MLENLSVKVDDLGRIVIPKKVRRKLNIKNNELLLLSIKEDTITIEKDNKCTEFDRLKEKVIKINKEYGLDFLITNDYKIVFGTNSYKQYENLKIYKREIEKSVFSNSTEIGRGVVITKPHYYCSLSFDNYTNGRLFVVFDSFGDEEYAKLIIDLLKS